MEWPEDKGEPGLYLKYAADGLEECTAMSLETFFLTHVDERAPAACRREEKGKSVQALRRIDL